MENYQTVQGFEPENPFDKPGSHDYDARPCR